MAERNTPAAKRADDSKKGEGKKTAGKVSPAAQLALENAALKSELEAARARITELENKQAEIVNRIDWVIDSLHNLPK